MSSFREQITIFSLLTKDSEQNITSDDTQWTDELSIYQNWFSNIVKDKDLLLDQSYKIWELFSALQNNKIIFDLIRPLLLPFIDKLDNSIDQVSDKILKLENNLLENKYHIFPLNALNSNKWELKNIINIVIEKNNEDEYISCFYEADIYGYGDSIPDAIEDLSNAIINQLEFLTEEEDNLGEVPQKQLSILRQVLREK